MIQENRATARAPISPEDPSPPAIGFSGTAWSGRTAPSPTPAGAGRAGSARSGAAASGPGQLRPLRRFRARPRLLAATTALILALAACDGDAERPGAEPQPSTEGQAAPPAPAGRPTGTNAPPATPADSTERAAAPASSTVLVYFTRNEQPVPVRRTVPPTRRVLHAALLALLEGPTPEERASGLTSYFSDRTAGMLNGVAVDPQGNAVVDFQDFRHIIPNASSSAGSRMLLESLNATVFQFRNVQSVAYRLDGSCEVFWEWLQVGGCPVVTRP